MLPQNRPSSGKCCPKVDPLKFQQATSLSAPKSQRFLRLRCPPRTPEIARFPRQEKAMLHCDLRVRWKVASDLRFRAAISKGKTPSFCGISGDLAPSTRILLAIAIVRFWCAKRLVLKVAIFYNCCPGPLQRVSKKRGWPQMLPPKSTRPQMATFFTRLSCILSFGTFGFPLSLPLLGSISLACARSYVGVA